MRSNISNALELSSRFGWKLFPAKSADKSPYINGWQQRATANASVHVQLPVRRSRGTSREACTSGFSPRTTARGSGKVAGKVLTVDLKRRFANLLI